MRDKVNVALGFKLRRQQQADAALAAERQLSETLARALQNYANLACFEVEPTPGGFTDQTRRALAAHDVARGAKSPCRCGEAFESGPERGVCAACGGQIGANPEAALPWLDDFADAETAKRVRAAIAKAREG